MSVDFELRRQHRFAEADPDNPQAFNAWFQARTRSEGEAVLLELLDHRRFWRAASTELQDRCVGIVASYLGADFRLHDTILYRCGGQAHRIAGFRHLPTGVVFQLIPAGAFLYGSDKGLDNEAPQLPRTLDKPFLLGRFPLTRDQFGAIPGFGSPSLSEPDHPLTGVSHNSAMSWLRHAGLRLPSEVEWEYACRAGTSNAYYWGPEMDDRHCWHWANSRQRTHHILEHEDCPNAFGLVDMLGHVREWCSDLWSPRHGLQADHSKSYEVRRVNRGGSWSSGPEQLRCSARSWRRPEWSGLDMGFRAAYSIPMKLDHGSL